MQAEIKNGKLIITIPVNSTPTESKTGKSKVVASTNGNVTTSIIIDGQPLVVGVNAYIRK